MKDRLNQLESLMRDKLALEGEIGEIALDATTGGKRLRPALVFLACESVGGDSSMVFSPALAIEMLHKHSLVHDDIIDRDAFRRGRPTTYSRYGSDIAILVGDLLLAASLSTLYETRELFSSEQVCHCMKVFLDAHKSLCIGQLQDMLLTKSTQVTENDYFKMVKNKTCGIPSAGIQIGAYLGGGNQRQGEFLSEYAIHLSIAFQIQNDLNNLLGVEEQEGRRTGSDISEGKATLMTIHALSNANQEQAEQLRNVLGNRGASDSDLIKTIRVLEETGSLELARLRVRERQEEARSCIRKLPVSEASSLLTEIVDLCTSSDYYRETDVSTT